MQDNHPDFNQHMACKGERFKDKHGLEELRISYLHNKLPTLNCWGFIVVGLLLLVAAAAPARCLLGLGG